MQEFNPATDKQLLLRWVEGQSIPEIAELLGKSEEKIRQVLERPEIQVEAQYFITKVQELKREKKNDRPLVGEDKKEYEALREKFIQGGYCPFLLDTFSLTELRQLEFADLKKKLSREEGAILRKRLIAAGYTLKLLRCFTLEGLRDIYHDFLEKQKKQTPETGEVTPNG